MTDAFPRYQVSLGANYVVRSDTFEQLVSQLNLLTGSQDKTTQILSNWATGLLVQSEKVANVPAPAASAPSANVGAAGPPSCQHGAMVRRKAKVGARAGKEFWACDGKNPDGSWLNASEKCKTINID